MAFKFETIEEIGSIRKNARENILARVCSVNNSVRLDVRIFFTEKASDKLKPTSKGLCMDLVQAKAVRDFLDKGIAELQQHGETIQHPETTGSVVR